MKASIAHKTKGRMRLKTPYNFTLNEANGVKFALERSEGVNFCKVNMLTGCIVLEYDERHVSSIAKKILSLNLKDFKDFVIPEKYETSFVEANERGLFEILRDSLERRFFIKNFLPAPIKIVVTLLRSYGYIKRGLKSLSEGKLNVEVLDATAISTSLIEREFGTAASIMFLLGLGEQLEDWTLKKSKADLTKSMELNVDRVLVVEGDKRYFKNLSEVKINELIEVTMGSQIPVDGEVVKGYGLVNQASFTGESAAVEKREGTTVFAGTVLEEGSLLVKTLKEFDDSRLNHIIKLISESEKNKSLLQKKAESQADRLVKWSFAGAALTYLLTRNFQKSKSFLMVDFSCALKLIIPIAIMKAISQAAESKILVKGGKYLENLADADTIVFDKTGTLTKSKPCVRKVIAFNGHDEDECLRIAACLEEHFPHPIANAVIKAAKEKDLHHDEMHSKPEYIVAHGIAAYIEDKRTLIGSYHFIFEDEKVRLTKAKMEKIEELKENYSLLYLAMDKKLIAVICIEDPLREDAKKTVMKLREYGFTKIAMLTGDAENSAAYVAKKLDLDYYKSQVLPEDKADFVASEKALNRTVVMVGDGINDSLALSSSDVGISMHEGADIAREIADISIGSDDLSSIVEVVRISKELKKRTARDYRNIILLNSALIFLGLAGTLSGTTSSLLHNGSTVISALNNMKPY